MKKIVKNRNDLIHHLLSKFDQNSIESCLKTDQYLDQQRDKFQPENDKLEKILLAGEQGKKNFLKCIKSGKFIAEFKLSRLRQSRIVILLADIASRKARPDGWTLLNTAGKITHEEEPAEMDAIKKENNFKTLKELILATDVFDIYEESTNKGGIRTLYRLKADRVLSPDKQIPQSKFQVRKKFISYFR